MKAKKNKKPQTIETQLLKECIKLVRRKSFDNLSSCVKHLTLRNSLPKSKFYGYLRNLEVNGLIWFIPSYPGTFCITEKGLRSVKSKAKIQTIN